MHSGTLDYKSAAQTLKIRIPPASMTDKPTTQQAIAKRLGVSRSTVTRALKGDRRISARQRECILGVAEEMGYRPNPLINALMAQISRGRVRSAPVSFAYVYDSRRPGFVFSDTKNLLTTLKCEADARGYDFSSHNFASGQSTASRFSDILYARGVSGLLLDYSSCDELWKYERFSTVSLGFRFDNPPLHFVTEDYFATSWHAASILRQKGFCRIGLALDSAFVGHSFYRYIGGFLAQQHASNFSDASESLYCSTPDNPNKSFSHWCRTFRPDSVICGPGLVEHGIARVYKGTICLLSKTTDRGGFCGMSDTMPDVVAQGVLLLSRMIERGEVGVPDHQAGRVVESSWIDASMEK